MVLAPQHPQSNPPPRASDRTWAQQSARIWSEPCQDRWPPGKKLREALGPPCSRCPGLIADPICGIHLYTVLVGSRLAALGWCCPGALAAHGSRHSYATHFQDWVLSTPGLAWLAGVLINQYSNKPASCFFVPSQQLCAPFPPSSPCSRSVTLEIPGPYVVSIPGEQPGFCQRAAGRPSTAKHRETARQRIRFRLGGSRTDSVLPPACETSAKTHHKATKPPPARLSAHRRPHHVFLP